MSNIYHGAMITSSLIEEVGIVTNIGVGAIELLELAEASLQTLRLADHNTPVLWDFRAAWIEVPADFCAGHTRSWINAQRNKISSARRAWIVRGDEQQAVVERILGHARAPWPWAIFHATSDALDWLDIDERLVALK